MADQIEELKTKGNNALNNNDIEEALKCYTEALALSPDNHVIYSNRSAAFCKDNRYKEALEDAEEAIRLKPDWAKGYSRKGAALVGMSDLEEGLSAYKEALKYDPQSEQIKDSIKECEAKLNAGPNQSFSNPFAGAGVLDKLRADPKTRDFFKDPSYARTIEALQKNPNDLGKYMQDPRMMKSLGVLLGIQLDTVEAEDMQGVEEEQPKQSATKNNTGAARGDSKSHGKGAAESKKDSLSPADKEKELGNAAYKQKDFATAAAHYLKAIEMCPDNIVYRNNLSAVHFEQGQYEECIKVCLEAVEVGRENRADFKLIAKALARIGNSYQRQGDLKNALVYFNKSLSEHRDSDVVKKTQEVQKAVAEQERLAYIDPAKSLEEKTLGNEFFQQGNYPKAIAHYSEAIKRNPTDAKLYSNRSACYTKLLEFSMAIRDADECIRLEPTFIKGYLRKAASLVAMKELSRASDAYSKALEIDPNCQEALDGYRTCNKRDSTSQEANRRQAMENPEVQAILSDPAMQLILQQMQKDPKALQEHLKNPDVAKKIEKLLEVGVIGFR